MKTFKFLLLALLLLPLSSTFAEDLYDFTLKDVKGQDLPLKTYKGKTLLNPSQYKFQVRPSRPA